MASSKPDDVEQMDLNASLHQLQYSIGHLKFSLKSLQSLQIQNVALPGKNRQNDHSEKSFKLPSNMVLEDIISSIASCRLEKNRLRNEDVQKNNRNVETIQKKSILNIDELELVHKKLQSELEKAKETYKACFSHVK